MAADILLTSDGHWDHDAIIGFCDRPFDSVAEMRDALITRWNDAVKPDDTVYYLGDGWMGRIETSLSYIRQLNGQIILLPGNHDRCWQGFENRSRKTYHDWEQTYLEAGIHQIIQTGAAFPFPRLDVVGHTVWLSHFPFEGDSHEQKTGDRYSAWRPPDEGQWLFHGHTHNAEGHEVRHGRRINVSVDLWDFRPVPLDWLASIITDAEAAGDVC